MILYELRCSADHAFEGWFPNSDGYDRQSAAGEVTCPICGTTDVSKAPMAPAVARQARPMVDPVTLLRAMRHHVETNCENVGANFAEEARRIHYGEAEARGIFGDSTPAEAEALADEGIEIMTIPWVPATDS
jgi:hypothetical protein